MSEDGVHSMLASIIHKVKMVLQLDMLSTSILLKD